MLGDEYVSLFFYLYRNMMELRRNPKGSREDEFDTLRSCFDAMLLEVRDLLEYENGELSMRTFPTSVEPSFTKVASACSVAGWIHEADTIFAVIRGPILTFIDRRHYISVQYLLHLKRGQRYKKLYSELLSELHGAYEDLAYPSIPS